MYTALSNFGLSVITGGIAPSIVEFDLSSFNFAAAAVALGSLSLVGGTTFLMAGTDDFVLRSTVEVSSTGFGGINAPIFLAISKVMTR